MPIEIDNQGVCSRIRQLRVEYAGARGKAAFARELGISPSTYDYYENSRIPPAEVLLRIADLTRVDLRWLLTGVETAGATGARVEAGHPAVVRAAKLLADNPQYGPALAAFVDLLAEAGTKFGTAKAPKSAGAASAGTLAAGALANLAAGTSGEDEGNESGAKQPTSSGDSLVAGKIGGGKSAVVGEVMGIPTPIARGGAADLVAGVAGPGGGGENAKTLGVVGDSGGDEPSDSAASDVERQGWIPILGRSAAGVPHFWSEAGGDDGGATMLADLVSMMRPRDARHVAQARAVGELSEDEGDHAQLVLLDTPEHPGTAEFVIAEHIASRYGVLFAVRIDGESMEPEISHGDVVILSPNCPAEAGKPAVVQLADQIGVTCKLVRFEADRVHLIPINETFVPTSYPSEQLVWALRVIARVRPV